MYAVVNLRMEHISFEDFAHTLEIRLNMERLTLEKNGTNHVRLEAIHRDYNTIFGIFKVTPS